MQLDFSASVEIPMIVCSSLLLEIAQWPRIMVGFFHKNDILLPSSEIWSSRCETQHWINRRIHAQKRKVLHRRVPPLAFLWRREACRNMKPNMYVCIKGATKTCQQGNQPQELCKKVCI
jgi:hypothetical protein